jgi:hypothetical protein
MSGEARKGAEMLSASLAILVLGAAAALGGWIGFLAVFGVLVVAGVVLLTTGRARRPRTAEAETGRDKAQRRRAELLVLLPLCAVIFAGLAATGADGLLAGEGSLRRALWPAVLVVLYAWVVVATLMGWDAGSRRSRRLLEDELSQAWRASALTLAFLVLLAGATGAFFVGLWRPEWTVIALPAVLAASTAAAAVRFVWLDRQAGLDG